MRKYLVKFSVVIDKEAIVWANNREEAEEQVEEGLISSEVDLDEDFTDDPFEVEEIPQ